MAHSGLAVELRSAFGVSGILLVPLFSQLHPVLLRLSFGASRINQPQVCRHRFTVFVGHVTQGIAHPMDNAQLHLSLGKYRFNGIWKASESITASDENILRPLQK